jgi:FKBP-type peptidyl-prolyl cis-trans isomerase
MNLKLAMRWMMTFGIGMAILVGSAAAQETATSNKNQQQAPAVSKPEPAAPTAKNTQEKAPETKPEQGAPANKAPQQDPAFQNWKDKLSYAIGADLARGLQWQRVDVNVDVLVGALKDALGGKKLVMTQEEVTATLKRFEDEQKQDFEHAKAMLSEKNRAAGDAFFAENLKKEGVVTLPSGLQYKILKQGDGKKPTLEDTVVCNYRGTLLDGKEFDSSYKRNQPATLPVKSPFKGWTEAFQLMPVGSKWQLFIPPHLAYGERMVGGIGPNAMLVFEVELISIQDKAVTVGAIVK